jgi:hypothetical protein
MKKELMVYQDHVSLLRDSIDQFEIFARPDLLSVPVQLEDHIPAHETAGVGNHDGCLGCHFLLNILMRLQIRELPPQDAPRSVYVVRKTCDDRCVGVLANKLKLLLQMLRQQYIVGIHHDQPGPNGLLITFVSRDSSALMIG